MSVDRAPFSYHPACFIYFLCDDQLRSMVGMDGGTSEWDCLHECVWGEVFHSMDALFETWKNGWTRLFVESHVSGFFCLCNPR